MVKKKQLIKNFPLYAGLILAVVFLVEMQKRAGFAGCASGTCFFAPASKAQPSALPEDTPSAVAEKPLPLLVDLGASKCIPCQKMKPTLDDFMENYADQFKTVFIDVSQNPQAGEQHSIRFIPTQIFFDAEGKELFRHEGFMSKEDILAKWQELGFDF